MTELKPIKNVLVQDFLDENKKSILKIINNYSSPLNVIFPQIFINNIEKFRHVFSAYEMEENIFFACKANKSNALIEAAIYKNIGLEVSSYYELQNILGKGTEGKKIIASGPGKTYKYLLLCLKCGAKISIDSEAELTNIIKLCKKISKKAQIIIRIDITKKSKFGVAFPIKKEMKCLINENKQILEVIGLSAHINNYNLNDRVKIIKKFIKICDQLKSMGHAECKLIDLGGGFTVDYTTKKEWVNLNKNKKQFWNGKKFNNFYPYYSDICGENCLDYILKQDINGKKVHRALVEGGYKLVIEPGRALLDQSGITIMKIEEVKKQNKDWLIVVDANINNISEQWFNTDFLVSPELITFNEGENTTPFECYIAGNLCLEQDMVSWHKISFETKPKQGDLLVFHNTAGYQMDSNETEFVRIPLAKKINAVKSDNEWIFIDDNYFSQVHLLGGI